MPAFIKNRLASKLLPLALAAVFASSVHAAVPAPQDIDYPGTIVLKVDASNLSQQLFRMKMAIPVKPGPMTMLYPEWLPANHGPNNVLNQLTGLKFSGNGKPIEWVRDPVDMFAFHLTVPEGVSTLEAEYQFLSPLDGSQGRITIASDILGIQWPAVTMYPAGYVARRITYQPSITFPAGWQYGTALETDKRTGDVVDFKPLDLETLIDSPLFAGRYFKRIDLDPGAKVPVFLNMVADSPENCSAPTTTSTTISCLPSPMSSAAWAASTTNPARTASSPAISRTGPRRKRAATCCRMSTPTPGTASSAALPARTSPISIRPCRTNCCGCTRARPSTGARCWRPAPA